MTPLCLLDADAVVDLVREVRPTVDQVLAIRASGATICVCDVVLAEVYSGLPVKERVETMRALDGLLFLWTAPDAAKQAGIWRYDYRRRGISLSATDTLIAATALAHGARLLTGNHRHFPMPELDVIPLPRGNT